MKKTLALILALLLLVSIFAGCGKKEETTTPDAPATETETSKPAEDEKAPASEEEDIIEITWATWALAEESLQPIYMSMIETFMEAHPNVKINTLTYPYSQYKDQLMIAAAGGNAPTFAHIKADWSKDFYNTGSVLTLNDAMSDELKNDFYAGILEGATVDGNIIAAPWFNTPSALFYNKTLLEQAGITELPTTWEELIEAEYQIAALGVNETGNTIYGTVLPNAKGEYGASFLSMPNLWSNGGGYSYDANGNLALDTATNLAAFEEIQKLYQDGVSPNGCSMVDGCNLFAQGVVGFYHYIQTGVSTFASASPLGEDFANEYGVIPMPGDGSENGPGYLTDHYIMFFDNGDLTPEEYEVVNDLIDWFSGEPVMRILYDAGMGKIPSRATTSQLDIFTTAADDVTKVFVEAAATCRSLPVSDPNFAVVDEYLIDALGELASTSDSAETILNRFNEKVAALS